MREARYEALRALARESFGVFLLDLLAPGDLSALRCCKPILSLVSARCLGALIEIPGAIEKLLNPFCSLLLGWKVDDE